MIIACCFYECAPNNIINNISSSFSSLLIIFLSVFFHVREAFLSEKWDKGVHTAPPYGVNCHVHLAHHLYLSPERIKRTPHSSRLSRARFWLIRVLRLAPRGELLIVIVIVAFASSASRDSGSGYAGDPIGDYNRICCLLKRQRPAQNYYYDEAGYHFIHQALQNLLILKHKVQKRNKLFFLNK